MEIQHFSHEHPLILHEDWSGVTCHGCRERIFGSIYRCEECWFSLHKSCAELPGELQHPLHREHPLILHAEPPYDSKQFKCKACEKTYPYNYKALFVYHCTLCKFDLDIKCAFLPLTMEAESHDHPLTLVTKSISFTCDACGKEGKGMPCLCAKCGILFHFNCASSPRDVENKHHKHPLKLTYSLKVDESDHQFCQICVGKVDLDYWVYHCSMCDFVSHLSCATDKEFRKFKVEGPINESTSLPKNEDRELDKINLEGEPVEIKHFSHLHDLTLSDNLDINNQKCDGCIRFIFPPFYSCAQCNFFLHKSCAELPKEKLHPLHQHPLFLLSKAPFNSKAFGCDACNCRYNCRCNGFVYHCDKCMFMLDVQCSLILDKLTHGGHGRPLFLSKAKNNLSCSACGGFKKNMLCCAKCEFTLDFSCATLPHTLWYRQHQHPFTLKFIAEDNSGEYYCDICEEPRNPKHWFYYCAECSYPAHPKCILGN